MLGNEHHRVTVWRQILRYYADEVEKNGPLQDFDFVCPPREEYEGFLNLSLSLEGEIVPEFAGRAKDEHREDFWRQVDTNKFCAVDVPSTLNRPQWKRFFANLSSN